MATGHATEARKELISAHLMTASKALGPRWACGFAAGIAWMGEVARRDAVLAGDVGALLEQLSADYTGDGGMCRDDLTAIATDFIRAWDLAAV